MEINKEQAEQIKAWRITLEYSYSKLSEKFQKLYLPKSQWRENKWNKDKPIGSSVQGRELVRLAMKFLNEEWEIEGLFY